MRARPLGSTDLPHNVTNEVQGHVQRIVQSRINQGARIGERVFDRRRTDGRRAVMRVLGVEMCTRMLRRSVTPKGARYSRPRGFPAVPATTTDAVMPS